jgi:superfamily II DNA or RNA helicase
MNKYVTKRVSNFELNAVKFTEFLKEERNREEKTTLLYDYQIDAVLKTHEYFIKHGTLAEPALIVAPTGSGKSGISSMLPYVLQSSKVLILSPSVVITNQLAKTFGLSGDVKESFFFKTHIFDDTNSLKAFLENGKVISSTSEIADMDLANLVFVNAQKFGGTSYTSLVRGSVEVVENVKNTFESFTTIIVDEAHHYPAETWYEIVNNFNGKQIIFLTATPFRNKGGKKEPILGPNQKITYEIPKDAIEGKTIRKCEYFEFPLHIPENGLGETEFNKISNDIHYVLDMHDAQEPSIKHQAMVLVYLTDEARIAAQLMKKTTYHTSDKKTDVSKIAFDKNDGTYRILVVCGKLLEGYDNSNISVCVILRKVGSQILFNQFVGRCLRISRMDHPDSVSALVMSYSPYNQRQMWDQYKSECISEKDPQDDE